MLFTTLAAALMGGLQVEAANLTQFVNMFIGTGPVNGGNNFPGSAIVRILLDSSLKTG